MKKFKGFLSLVIAVIITAGLLPCGIVSVVYAEPTTVNLTPVANVVAFTHVGGATSAPNRTNSLGDDWPRTHANAQNEYVMSVANASTNTTGNTAVIYLQFDISALSPVERESITAASLSLTGVANGTANRSVNVYKLNSAEASSYEVGQVNENIINPGARWYGITSLGATAGNTPTVLGSPAINVVYPAGSATTINAPNVALTPISGTANDSCNFTVTNSPVNPGSPVNFAFAQGGVAPGIPSLKVSSETAFVNDLKTDENDYVTFLIKDAATGNTTFNNILIHSMYSYDDGTPAKAGKADNRPKLNLTYTVGGLPSSPPTVTAKDSPASLQTSGTDVTVTAETAIGSADGPVTHVEFYRNGSLSGTAYSPTTGSEYQYTYEDITAGGYEVTAIAYNSAGASEPAAVASFITTTGVAPTVTIGQRSSNQYYKPTEELSLRYNVNNNTDGFVEKIEFFNNEVKIGEKAVISTTNDYYHNINSSAGNNYLIGYYCTHAIITLTANQTSLTLKSAITRFVVSPTNVAYAKPVTGTLPYTGTDSAVETGGDSGSRPAALTDGVLNNTNGNFKWYLNGNVMPDNYDKGYAQGFYHHSDIDLGAKYTITGTMLISGDASSTAGDRAVDIANIAGSYNVKYLNENNEWINAPCGVDGTVTGNVYRDSVLFFDTPITTNAIRLTVLDSADDSGLSASNRRVRVRQFMVFSDDALTQDSEILIDSSEKTASVNVYNNGMYDITATPIIAVYDANKVLKYVSVGTSDTFAKAALTYASGSDTAVPSTYVAATLTPGTTPVSLEFANLAKAPTDTIKLFLWTDTGSMIPYVIAETTAPLYE